MTSKPALFRFHRERHADARLLPGTDIAEYAQVQHVKLGLHEIGEAAADYPLVLLKDANSGQFQLVALLGLAVRTNSYLHGDFWQAVYLPHEIVAAPFSLGGNERVLCINEASARVATDVGDSLFAADGSEASVLQGIRAKLDELEQGRSAADQFVAAVAAADLIRPVSVTIEFETGPTAVLDGLYTLGPGRLRGLEPAALVDLHSRDFLAPAYAIMQSLSQLNRVRQLHNLQSAQQINALELVMEQH